MQDIAPPLLSFTDHAKTYGGTWVTNYQTARVNFFERFRTCPFCHEPLGTEELVDIMTSILTYQQNSAGPSSRLNHRVLSLHSVLVTPFDAVLRFGLYKYQRTALDQP